MTLEKMGGGGGGEREREREREKKKTHSNLSNIWSISMACIESPAPAPHSVPTHSDIHPFFSTGLIAGEV